MKNAWNKFRNNLDATREDESGDIVQTILIIAVFVAIVIVVGNLLYKAISKKGTDVSSCINGTTAGTIGSASKGC